MSNPAFWSSLTAASASIWVLSLPASALFPVMLIVSPSCCVSVFPIEGIPYISRTGQPLCIEIMQRPQNPDFCSLVYDELCDMRDAACALGRLGFDPQSLFVDHLVTLVTAAISHCPDQRPRFRTILTGPYPLHSDEPQFPLCLAILLSTYPGQYVPGRRNRQSLPRV